MAEPALDIDSLMAELHATRCRLADAEERASQAERKATDAQRRALLAETHVALAEARARRLMEVGRRYRALVGHLPDTTLVVYDSDLRYQVVEGSAMGRPEDMEGRTLHELFSPEIARALEGSYRRTLDGGEWDHEIRHGDRTYLVQGRPLHAEDGSITAGLVLSRDITRLKRAEEALRREREGLRQSVAEREVLLREVYHRVKNNLQVVSSMLSLQSRTLTDPVARDALLACRQRVSAMARVHEQLYRSGDVAHIDLSTYLTDLSSELDRTYRVHGGIRLELDLESVDVDLQRAIPVGLVAHELVANAFQHAFPDERAGTIRVSLRGSGVDGFDLVIEDDGVGTAPSDRRTLGTRLVRSLAQQLGGELTMDTDPGRGTRWSLHAPGSPT